LHELDCDAAGFEWIISDDSGNSVFAWLRKARDGNGLCVVVVNFTPEVRRGYRVKVPRAARWRELLNSDAAVYGGGNVGNSGAIETIDDGAGPELALVLPPLAALFLAPEGRHAGAVRRAASARGELERARNQFCVVFGACRESRAVPVRPAWPARARAHPAAGVHRRRVARLPAGCPARPALRVSRL